MNGKIDELLHGYPERVAGMAYRLRQLILAQLKGIDETPDLPAKLIAYGYGPGYKHTICTIILSKKGIKLGLWRGTELPDPEGLLQGSGKVHRYVAIGQDEDIDNPALVQLLVEASNAYRVRIGELG